jgi:hypothetical protein
MYAKLHKWEEVYRRDGYRCQNPVCVRCDVTLHHLLYRAMGGGDALWNVLALCPPCHLEGEHEGRLKVIEPADEPTWMLGLRGRAPLIVVKGRRRIRSTEPLPDERAREEEPEWEEHGADDDADAPPVGA